MFHKISWLFPQVLTLLVVIGTHRVSCFTEIPPSTVSTTRHVQRDRVSILLGMEDRDEESWLEAHLIHGAAEIHEETEKELLKSEDWAAYDAHDLDDPGMEAAVMEAAVVLAAKLAHEKKEKAMHPVEAASKKEDWAEEHLIHGAAEIHEDTDVEMLQAEEWAVYDAHDCDDAGMEAAVMERAVMMAAEMAKARKRNPKPQAP
eukprot:scaffold12868_cov96-Cylindrotheca_fusiformis.AAC.2